MSYKFIAVMVLVVAVFGFIGYTVATTPAQRCAQWADQGETQCTGYMPGHTGGYADLRCRHIMTCVRYEEVK